MTDIIVVVMAGTKVTEEKLVKVVKPLPVKKKPTKKAQPKTMEELLDQYHL